MYSPSSKNKLEAAATIAASVLLAAGPSAAVAAMRHHEARLARQARKAAAQAGVSPFETIDREGVGQLVELAVQRGRAARSGLEIGVCGR